MLTGLLDGIRSIIIVNDHTKPNLLYYRWLLVHNKNTLWHALVNDLQSSQALRGTLQYVEGIFLILMTKHAIYY